MNILCSFALSQIKRKKSRTVITASAIALSAALLTAVVNFAASGEAMLAGFLGKDYGLYGNAYTMLLFVPALFLAALIVAMSVIVISNAFRMSANERMTQFGTLKCVGATKHQIYKTIMYECVLLCIVAIPLGILLGYLLSFVGIRVANLYMEELNVLVRSMMKRVSLSLSFVFSPIALVISVVISLGTVLFAAMLPARKAMRISALDCMKNGGETDTAGYKRTPISMAGTQECVIPSETDALSGHGVFHQYYAVYHDERFAGDRRRHTKLYIYGLWLYGNRGLHGKVYKYDPSENGAQTAGVRIPH